MTPCLTFLNAIDRVLGNAVPVGQRLARKSVGVGEYVNGSLIGKPFHATCFTSCLSAFCSAIGVILGSGAKKKMSRVAASRVVAGVANEQTARYGAMMDLIRQPMELSRRPAELVDTVSVAISGADVGPAFIVPALRHPLGKSLCQPTCSAFEPAIDRAVLSSTDAAGKCFKPLTTPLAYEMDPVFPARHRAELRGLGLRRLYSKVLTAPFTNYVVRGILGAHMNHLSCAMPSTVPAVRGLSYASNYTKFRMVAGQIEGVTV